MTIAAGFCATDGVLLCADTLHTGIGANLYGTKLVTLEISAGKVAFTFTGNSEFAQATIDKCIKRLRSQQSLVLTEHDIVTNVEAVFDGQYRRLVHKRPDRNMQIHGFQLLVAVWTQASGVSLYSTWDLALKKCHEYACVGAGEYLGHYLIRPLFQPGMRLSEIAITATYAFAKAKEYVEGCGGQTNFIVLRTSGQMREVSWHVTEPVEKLLKEYDDHLRAFFPSLTDSNRGFHGSLKTLSGRLKSIRRKCEPDDSRGLVRTWLSHFEGGDGES